MKDHPKVLIYKRTHRGDPDDRKIFGVDDCMGKIRTWDFDAVIGVGGKKPDKGDEGIARKINWVGIDAVQKGSAERGPRWAFRWFHRFDETGPDIKALSSPWCKC